MTQRYIALDALRGLTLALMLIVNTPGSWSHVYAPLEHAEWSGWTMTDLVFPFFLFIVGASLFFSQKGMASLSRVQQIAKIGRRTLLLIAIGVVLEWYPFLHGFDTLRLPGVLQRIGLVFGIAALIVICLPARWNGLWIVLILLSYQALLQLSSEPYSLEHNVVRQVDLWLFGANHLWTGKGIAFDPEGLLSSWPAVATVLLGYEAARFLRSGRLLVQLQLGLWCAGALLVALVAVFDLVINKSLWTPGYVLHTAGLACWTLAVLLLAEQWRIGRLCQQPLVWLGQNPLFIYILSWLWVRTYFLFPTQAGTAYDSLFELFAQWLPLKAASLTFALVHLLVLWALAYFLARRRIFIKL